MYCAIAINLKMYAVKTYSFNIHFNIIFLSPSQFQTKVLPLKMARIIYFPYLNYMST